MTTVSDGAGEGSAKASWVLMRRSKKRTGIGPHLLDRAPPARREQKPYAPTGRTPTPHRFAERSPTPPRTRSHRPGRPSPRRNGSPDGDHALIRFDPQVAALIDDCGMDGASEGTAKARKNRTGIGPHPPAPGRAQNPVISVVEVGYVRRSEFTVSVDAGTLPIAIRAYSIQQSEGDGGLGVDASI